MDDIQTVLKKLRRPGLLIRAARFGLEDYRRERDLARIMKADRIPGPFRVLETLIALEADAEATRIAGAAAYSAARHIELLIAMMAEAQLLPQPEPQL